MITTDNSQTLANALAEIKRLEAEIQRQREKHRRTWRQLEQATHWLQVAADTLDDLQPGSALEQQIRATLSQQTEPIKPAPAQDARTTLAEALASAEWPNVSIGNKALIMRAIELLTRPAQTAPQPEQSERYTCIGKGGEYELIGCALPAGELAGLMVDTMQPELVVYRSEAGIFVRSAQDFKERMERLLRSAAPA